MASGCGAGTVSFPTNVVRVQLGLACFLRSPSPISLWYFIWVFTCFIILSVLILFLLSNEFSFSVTGAGVLLVAGVEARGWVLLVAGVGARGWASSLVGAGVIPPAFGLPLGSQPPLAMNVVNCLMLLNVVNC